MDGGSTNLVNARTGNQPSFHVHVQGHSVQLHVSDEQPRHITDLNKSSWDYFGISIEFGSSILILRNLFPDSFTFRVDKLS